MKIMKSGKCEIVSSGYDDRFLMSSYDVILLVDGIEYRVNPDQATKAIAKMRGVSIDNIDALSEISKELINIPTNYFATYEVASEFGHTTITAIVRPSVISAGIAVANGFIRLTEYGIDRAIKGSADISESEKDFIRFGLEQVNKKHLERGKPVIDFNI